MACIKYRVKPKKKSLIYEEDLGDPEFAEEIRRRAALPKAHPDYWEDAILGGDEDMAFMCGPGADAALCEGCDEGYLSTFLCDYPVGKGKTCDLPLCDDCTTQIAKNRHLCPIHLAEHRGKTDVKIAAPEYGKLGLV